MWQRVKLEDVCTKITDGSHFSPKTVEVGYPYITVKDVSEKGIDYENCKFVSEESYQKLKDNGCAPTKGEVLFSKDGTVGKVALVTSPKEFVVLSSLAILTPNQTRLSPEFLCYVLKSASFLREAVGRKTGVAIRRIILKNLKKIEIPLPPLAEQQCIVAKLDAAFAEIDRAVETCEEQISETIKLEFHSLTSLFSRDGHVVRRLNELAQIKGGKRLPKGKKLTTEDTGFPYIRVSDFNDNGSVDEESVQFVEPEVQTQISRYTISSDDVYVSIAGTIGKTGIVPPNLDKANLTENAAKLVFKDGVDRDFVYFFTRTSSFEKQAIAQTRQAAQPKLALERLGAVELPIYELPQQRQIAFDAKLLTEEIAKVIANREEKLSQLDALKSAILTQELQPPQSEAA